MQHRLKTSSEAEVEDRRVSAALTEAQFELQVCS